MAEVTADQVRRWLVESCLAGCQDRLAGCFAKGPFAVRANSRLFYAQCSAVPSPLLVKLCLRPRTSQADAASAQRQYDSLLRVSQAMGDGSEFSVPRPYLVRGDIGLLAAEWIPGTSMTDLIFSWRCGFGRARDLVVRAARWLSHFHACHALAPGVLQLDKKLAFIAQMETSRAVSDPAFLEALLRLRKSAPFAAAVPLSRTWIHGDFKTDNLMVSGSRTVGIDIHLQHEAPMVFDLATFLNELELRLCYPSGWRLLACRLRLRQAFLSNYPQGNEQVMDLPLTWVRLYMLLAKWHTASTNKRRAMRTRTRVFCYRTVALPLARKLARA